MQEHSPKQRAEIIDVHVGRRLKTGRSTCGISQENLAEVLGVTFQQVQKYEGGKNRISAGKLYLCADFLGLPITYFFDPLSHDTSLSPDRLKWNSLFDDIPRPIRSDLINLLDHISRS